MSRNLTVISAGPGLAIQDLGRVGHMGLGLSRSGAVDRSAFLQGVALLGNAPEYAALEIAGMGGVFRSDVPMRIAFSGARMTASADGEALEHNASHFLAAGVTIKIGAVTEGVYGYLSVGGGLDGEVSLGGRGHHSVAGLGHVLTDGDVLDIGPDTALDAAPKRLALAAPGKGAIRMIEGPQTAMFSADVRARFEATTFTRSPRGNRQGVRLDHEGNGFAAGDQLQQVSDFIAEGDIQMTGDGTPYVLLADCQTMGGYPRIGTVIPADLPRIAQAAPGTALTFKFIGLSEAAKTWVDDTAMLSSFTKALKPKTRDPREMRDLLSYNLIDGVVSGE